MASEHYVAHARRIEMVRRVAPGPLAEYYAGYRAGMVRTTRTAADESQDAARQALAERALRGEEPDLSRAAWGCGYHDGQNWHDVTAHRGLLRLAILLAGDGSARGFARMVWGIDEASVRQMLAGTRPIPASRHAELLDRVAGAAEAIYAEPSDE